MRAVVNDFARFPLPLLAALLWIASAASAEASDLDTPRQAGADQWVPSLAVISGITIQRWNGEVSSEICEGCTTPIPLRPTETGNDLDVTPFVGGQLELMTPELSVPLSPRFFLGFDLSGAFGTERQVANEGDPSTLASPLPESAAATAFDEKATLGQGSRTSAEFQAFLVTARAGVAFPLELFGRALRIKPSINWARYEIEVKGLIVDADCATSAAVTNCNPLVGGAAREIRLSDNTTESFDGIGPGLDFELDTGRIGPLGSSLFLGAAAYRILGNRDVDLSASASYPDSGIPGIGAATTNADFHFDVEEWMYRVTMGLRLQWIGSQEN